MGRRDLTVEPPVLDAWYSDLSADAHPDAVRWRPAQAAGAGLVIARWQSIRLVRQRTLAGSFKSTPSAEPSTRSTSSQDRASPASTRDTSDEAYVLDLLDDVLGAPCQRQARFPWLVGDVGSSGRQAQLPVDGYWPDRQLVVEYRERQHDEPTPHFDKPDTPTVSGVHRGEQRRIYDERRDHQIPAHGLRLVIVRPSDLSADSRGRLRREPFHDRNALLQVLHTAGIH